MRWNFIKPIHMITFHFSFFAARARFKGLISGEDQSRGLVLEKGFYIGFNSTPRISFNFKRISS